MAMHTPLSRRTKLLYGAGDLGFSLTETVIGVLYAIFLTDVVGLKPSLAALAVFIGRSSDYVNDPLIGYLSDRTRSRWGRRRPFLLFGALPYGLAFVALWLRPAIASPAGLVAYYALAYVFYDAAATFVYMPYYALTPELTPDYDERTALTSYRMAFSIVGGLVAFTVPLAIIGTMQPDHAGRVLAMAAGIAVLSATPLWLTFLGTREQPRYQPLEAPALSSSLRAALRNRPFVFAAGLFLFTWTGMEIIQVMLLYFLKYRLLMEAQSDIIAGVVFIVALLTLPGWEWASRHWDKRVAYIVGMVFLSVVMVTLISATPAWGLTLVLSLAALAGIGVGAVHVLPWALIPDAVEWDEWQTGQRHEGVFYSLVTLMRKVATSIAIPLALLALDRTGYVANQIIQAPSAVRTIQTLMGPIPAALFGVGIVFAIVYPLGRSRHAEIRQALAERAASREQGAIS